MCSICGALVAPDVDLELLESQMKSLVIAGSDRGRDSYGIVSSNTVAGASFKRLGSPQRTIEDWHAAAFPSGGFIVNNDRAEPTTEYVKHKSMDDVQPFQCGSWVVAHNGVIANDKELCQRWNLHPKTSIDSAVIGELLNARWGVNMPSGDEIAAFLNTELVGSYALAIGNLWYPERILLMCNYKPLYIAAVPGIEAIFFTSLEQYIHTKGARNICDGETRVTQLEPYTACEVYWNVGTKTFNFKEWSLEQLNPPVKTSRAKALIVCSGGLDSTVVAAKAKADGYDITLLHFLYKCRAETKEQKSVKAIAKRLGCEVVFIDTDIFKDTIGGSRLTNSLAEEVAEGESGAEFAHEWVPARNMIMLSIAVGYAEAHGFETIMLGNNLEESGAYPDNEMIFIQKMNEVLPYATQVNKRVRIEMPVGNLMKWEIVKLGLAIDAPLDLCWSCYEPGEIHCGHCGPCFMRKTAFAINQVPEVIPYATDDLQRNE